MRNIHLRYTSSPPDGMVDVLKPECGRFSIETVKRWAMETLFIEEGVADATLSLDEAIHILHKYKFARIKS